MPPAPIAPRTVMRQTVLAEIAAGASINAAARAHHLAPSTVHYWVRNARGPADGRCSINYEALRSAVLADPDITLDVLARQLQASRNGVWRALQCLGLKTKRAFKRR